MVTTSSGDDARQFALATRALAGLCHRCGICPYAAERPDSGLEKLMRWHRTWCPGWKAHTKVYGEKALVQR
jgi:hypothetical protein